MAEAPPPAAAAKSRVAKPPTVTQRLEYAILRSIAALLKPFSWKTASNFGARLGGLGYAPCRIRADRVERYIRAAFPDISAARVREIARESYRGLGRVTIESIILSREPKETVIAAFSGTENWELLEAALAEGRGVVLVSGHIGSWELSAAYMAARGVPVDAIAMHMANPLSDGFFKRTRERFGTRVLFDDQAVRAIPRAFKDGRAVGFLSDQGALGLASTFVDFFGRPAKTPRGAAVFALRGQLPMLFIAAIRQPDLSYRFIVRKVPLAESGDRERDVDDTVRNYTKVIEDCVREHPEQYFWQHRRWKRQPPDTPPHLREP
jgi:Kdo2-lipid IVA lauroyltransferase/acyltransferase